VAARVTSSRESAVASLEHEPPEDERNIEAAPWEIDFAQLQGAARREVWREAKEAVLELESWGFVATDRGPAEWCWYLDDLHHWPILRLMLVLGRDCKNAGREFNLRTGLRWDAADKARQLERLDWYWHHFTPLTEVLDDLQKKGGMHDPDHHRAFEDSNPQNRVAIQTFKEVTGSGRFV
jgi:hypothetical protein